MSIQGNVNQMLSLAGLLASQSSLVKNRQQAKQIEGRAIAAHRSLEDIYGNYQKVKSGEKTPYTELEVADIEGRIKQNVHDIYSGVIAADDPNFASYIDRGKFGGSRSEGRSEMLGELGGFREQNAMAIVQRAKQKAAEARQARNAERLASTAFIRSQDPRFRMEMNRMDQGGGI